MTTTGKRISDALNAYPFSPFKLIMEGGDNVTVDSPEFASIDREGRFFKFYDPGNENHFIDTLAVITIVTEHDE